MRQEIRLFVRQFDIALKSKIKLIADIAAHLNVEDTTIDCSYECEMLISDILPLLTAFGLGSIVTALVQSWLQRRNKIDDRNFDERKKAYVGLLEAYHKAAVEPSDANSKNFAYWQMRCDLVAPKSVRNAIEEIVATNDNLEGRYRAHEQLKAALRSDLSVSKE